MIVTAMLTMVGLGVFFAVILGIANKRFHVEENPKIEELSQILPGLNCGACGFPSCHEFARAMIEGQGTDTSCRVAGGEAIEMIAEITGKTEQNVKKIAVPFCGAKSSDKTSKAVYKGVMTCLGAEIISGGGMNCAYGCIGLGDCMRSCPFDAIRMADGLPNVDPEKCVACGKCVTACPRGILELVPYDSDNLVLALCRSKDPGSLVRKNCKVGCIGCGICEKLSGGVLYVEENHSKIDITRVKEDIKWEEVIKKCPMKTIVRLK